MTSRPQKTTRAAEGATITIGQGIFLTVAALAERHHTSVDEMAVELIHDGIAARTTRHVREHRCTPGEINPRFCRTCSKPMTAVIRRCKQEP